MEFVQNFKEYKFTGDLVKGNIAGYIGAICVYPIDLIKSNMQLQTLIYKNGFDCFKQIIKTKGITKLYSGSLIQIIGIGPEKAIKLYTNQYLLDNNYNPIIAGSCAGLSQVLITNPVEILKIQYQININKKINLIKALEMIGGIKNLYKGSTICALRDIPFCGIYFPTYTFAKNKLNKLLPSNNNNNCFFAGIIAAIPAAFLVTPFDVIKTRIQAKPNIYNKILFTINKIWIEEGFKAFFKGSGWRIAKSSPQFAITLYVYEILK